MGVLSDAFFLSAMKKENTIHKTIPDEKKRNIKSLEKIGFSVSLS